MNFFGNVMSLLFNNSSYGITDWSLSSLRFTQTWVWVNSESWWWTGRPGVLRFMGSQRVGHDWVTDLIWSDLWEDTQNSQKLCFPWLSGFSKYTLCNISARALLNQVLKKPSLLSLGHKIKDEEEQWQYNSCSIIHHEQADTDLSKDWLQYTRCHITGKSFSR